MNDYDYDYCDDENEYNTPTDYKPQQLQEEFDISMFGFDNSTNSCDSTNNSTTCTPSLYIDWQIFEENVDKCFICSSPIGSGKSTAIRKWIVSTYTKSKYIVIVPTVNIAMEFYGKMYTTLLSTNPDIDNIIRVCVNRNAFMELKASIKSITPIVITTYSTAAKCLGDLVEYFYRKQQSIKDQYRLVIDEAHLLLEHISLIELCREFDKVSLLSATIEDIEHFSVFDKFVHITPPNNIHYNRTIYLQALHPNKDEFRTHLVQQVATEITHYDKVLVKIEDKQECITLRQAINNELKKALYNSETKEVEISDEGKFVNPEDVDIVLATSCIQAGQSLKDNIVQIFGQTALDTVSSVKQFIGRNRNVNSTIHLYVNYKKPYNKARFSYRTGENRYKTHLNLLRARAWKGYTKSNWITTLQPYGNVIEVEDPYTTNTKKIALDNIVGKIYTSKRELIRDIGIAEKELPKEYSIKSERKYIDGKRTRLYSVICT